MSASGSAVPCDIKDLALAEGGKRRIEWAFQSMPALASVRKQFIKTQVFSGVRLAACVPITAETANLIITLRDGGAKIAVCASHEPSVQDDVAASLVKDYLVPVFGKQGAGDEPGPALLDRVLSPEPRLIVDQTGVLALRVAGNEEIKTTADFAGATVQANEGGKKLRVLAREGRLGFPVLSGSGSLTRRIFHSRIGAGQSTLDVLVNSLNLLLAGLNVVVVGFGGVGRGIAARAKGAGAMVIVTEVDPIRALEAVMEGHRVLSMSDAASVGDVFITATGNRDVIGREHFDKLRNGAILANAGYSDAEIDLGTLEHIVSSRRKVRGQVEEMAMRDGRRIYLLAGGHSLHSGFGEGYPSSVLDLSFANQALSAEYLVKNRETLRAEVYAVPVEIDRQVARLKLEAAGIKIDRLTVEQEQYLANLMAG